MRDDLRAARLRFMGDGKPPAATLVGVQSLASEEWLVEIEVTAVIR
jgi:enamine deaminase RidA (YjgF/YER057c/UK114 family)